MYMLSKSIKKLKAIPAISKNDEHLKLLNNIMVASIGAYFAWIIIVIQYFIKIAKSKKAEQKLNAKKNR